MTANTGGHIGAPFTNMDKVYGYPNGKVRGANMVSIWGRQDPGGPHVGTLNLAIWVTVWRNIHMANKVLAEFTYRLPIFNGATG